MRVAAEDAVELDDALEAAFHARPERPKRAGFHNVAGIAVEAWRAALGDLAPLLAKHDIAPPSAQRVNAAVAGVADLTALKPRARHRPFTLESVVGALWIFSEGGTWWPREHPDDRAAPAIIQPVLAGSAWGTPQIVDLVAWHPAKPAAWRLLTGLGQHLGYWPEDRLLRDVLDTGRRVLKLAATPMDWLKHPERVCLLTYEAAALARTMDYEAVHCGGDDALAAIIRDFYQSRLPEIRVR